MIHSSRYQQAVRVLLTCVALLCGTAMGAKAADNLTYIVHQPAVTSDHPPVLILLHGFGADEKDLFGLWPQLPQNLLIISVRAPYPVDGGGYRWYEGEPRSGKLDGNVDQVLASRKAIDALTDDVVKRFKVDPHKIFLAGFSQGANMVYQVILQEPGKYRGGAVLSGTIFPSERAVLSVDTDRSHDALFVGHGTDDNRIPYPYATEAKTILAALKVPTEFHSYKGMGHQIIDAEVSDLKTWLEKREK